MTEAQSICRHFLRGRCTFGDDCSFSHEVAPNPAPWIRTGGIASGALQSFQHPAPVEDRSVCRHFLEGKCNYGDACRFSHAGFPLSPPVLEPEPFMPALDETPPTERSVCRHFLEGKCTYGNACRFSHQGSAEDPTAWPTAPSTKVAERPTCRHFLEGKCSYGDACRFSHEDGLENYAQPTVDDRSVCRHFLEGKCTYGGSCRFLHTGDARLPERFLPPAVAPTAKALERYGPVRTNRAPATATVSPIYFETRTCRHFLAGKCTYGDLCTFVHPGSPSTKDKRIPPAGPGKVRPSSAQEWRQICRHFLVGRCNYADNCSFSHDLGLVA